MILHRPSPNQPKNVTHTNFQVNPSIIRVHRRMQAEIQVFEPLTVVGDKLNISHNNSNACTRASRLARCVISNTTRFSSQF